MAAYWNINLPIEVSIHMNENNDDIDIFKTKYLHLFDFVEAYTVEGSIPFPNGEQFKYSRKYEKYCIKKEILSNLFKDFYILLHDTIEKFAIDENISFILSIL